MQTVAVHKRMFGILISFLLYALVPLLAADLKPEEVVTRHIQSLGSAQARSAIKSRVVESTATYKVLTGGALQLAGKAVFASEGRKSRMLLKVAAPRYSGEQFICDGERTSVAATNADKTYSDLGDFMKVQDAPLREGLVGGALTTAWPLLELENRKAKLSYEGLKNIESHQLEVIRYRPKKSTDLEILLYFDPETYRHVMTTYQMSIQAGIGAGEIQSARQQETRYRIEERFSEFQNSDGLTLPFHYELRFTKELQNGSTKLLEWDVAVSRVLNNVSLDPQNFQIK
jgi:hypothetical protein